MRLQREPTATGAIVKNVGGEAKELVAGYSVLQCATREDAIEWVWRCVQVMGDGGECEVRQIQEEEDFPAELRAQVPEVFERERALRERAGQ